MGGFQTEGSGERVVGLRKQAKETSFKIIRNNFVFGWNRLDLDQGDKEGKTGQAEEKMTNFSRACL